MPRGGARPGAGRPPGSHGETAKIIQQAADDGVLPLKVMLDNLRFYTNQAEELIAKLLDKRVPEMEGDARLDAIEAIKDALGLRKLRDEQAARAAAYCHPRQGNVLEDGVADDFVPIADRIAWYGRRDEAPANVEMNSEQFSKANRDEEESANTSRTLAV